MRIPRKWMIFCAVPLVALFTFGCPKKAPVTPTPEPTEVETVDTDMGEPIDEPMEPSTDDEMEKDPLMSEDLAEVNREAQRQGFVADVYFDFDRSELREAARQDLANNANWLRQHPEMLLTIEGHCDERGTNEYNLALGQRRASSARDYLVSLGVEAGRFRTISYGEERPVCTQSDEGCWQRNRRAHMVITGRQ